MDFTEFLEEKRSWYQAAGRVFCPVLGTEVVFNAKGFYHLRYKSCGRARTVSEQVYKMSLLPLVMPVIQTATKIYDYKKGRYSDRFKKHYEIWELKETVGDQGTAVSVVLRRIGDGQVTFFSVWKGKSRKSQKPSN